MLLKHQVTFEASRARIWPLESHVQNLDPVEDSRDVILGTADSNTRVQPSPLKRQQRYVGVYGGDGGVPFLKKEHNLVS